MRHHLFSPLSPLVALSSFYMIWKTACIATDSGLPVVVVVSESMAPAFHRGDLLLLWNRDAAVRVGDVPLVWFLDQPHPMVHRVVQSHWIEGEGLGSEPVYVAICLMPLGEASITDLTIRFGRQHILTKGDNNEVDDVSLYPPGRVSVLRNEIRGVVRGSVPFLGWAVIIPREMVRRVVTSLTRL